MRILFFNGLWQGLKKALEDLDHEPFDLMFGGKYPDDWYAVLESVGLETGSKVLVNRTREINPDAIVVFKGWYQDGIRITPQTVKDLKKASNGALMIYWSLDDPHFLESYIMNGPYYDHVRYYDLVLTCCRGVEYYYKQIGNVNVATMYPAFDETMWSPEGGLPEAERYDFGIVGSVYRTPLDRPELCRMVASEGLTVAVWGAREQWEAVFSEAEMEEWYKGSLAIDQVDKAYHSCKINFNSHIRPDGFQYLNSRVFEVMGCGEFLLTDEIPGIGKLFKSHNTLGQELGTYVVDLETVTVNALNQVKYYMNKGFNYTQEVGRNARRRILKDGTYRHRADELLNWIYTFKGDK